MFSALRMERLWSIGTNLAKITPPNPSGRTQLDGTTEITDVDQTEANKALVKGFGQ